MTGCTSGLIHIIVMTTDGNGSGGVDQDGIDPASVWDTVAAADIPEDTGHVILPMVSGIWTVRRNTTLCNSELCIL